MSKLFAAKLKNISVNANNFAELSFQKLLKIFFFKKIVFIINFFMFALRFALYFPRRRVKSSYRIMLIHKFHLPIVIKKNRIRAVRYKYWSYSAFVKCNGKCITTYNCIFYKGMITIYNNFIKIILCIVNVKIIEMQEVIIIRTPNTPKQQ